MAYRGYLIKKLFTGEVFIEKGGALIGWAQDIDEAKRNIDMLLED